MLQNLLCLQLRFCDKHRTLSHVQVSRVVIASIIEQMVEVNFRPMKSLIPDPKELIRSLSQGVEYHWMIGRSMNNYRALIIIYIYKQFYCGKKHHPNHVFHAVPLSTNNYYKDIDYKEY